MNKYCLLLITFNITLSGAALEKKSKNSIKEEIGTGIKDTIEKCNILSARTAKLQLKIAELEKKLLDKGNDLLDDGPSFRKQAQKDLIATHKTITEIEQRLDETVEKINADHCLGSQTPVEDAG